MSTEDVVSRIMDLVYESKPVSSNPVVQKAAIRSGIWDLVQTLEDAHEEDLQDLRAEVEELESEIRCMGEYDD